VSQLDKTKASNKLCLVTKLYFLVAFKIRSPQLFPALLLVDYADDAKENWTFRMDTLIIGPLFRLLLASADNDER